MSLNLDLKLFFFFFGRRGKKTYGDGKSPLQIEKNCPYASVTYMKHIIIGKCSHAPLRIYTAHLDSPHMKFEGGSRSSNGLIVQWIVQM